MLHINIKNAIVHKFISRIHLDFYITNVISPTWEILQDRGLCGFPLT